MPSCVATTSHQNDNKTKVCWNSNIGLNQPCYLFKKITNHYGEKVVKIDDENSAVIAISALVCSQISADFEEIPGFNFDKVQPQETLCCLENNIIASLMFYFIKIWCFDLIFEQVIFIHRFLTNSFYFRPIN